MNEIASERTNTMIIPFPLDLVEPFIDVAKRMRSPDGGPPRPNGAG
jgi:hypothetical protein